MRSAPGDPLGPNLGDTLGVCHRKRHKTDLAGTQSEHRKRSPQGGGTALCHGAFHHRNPRPHAAPATEKEGLLCQGGQRQRRRGEFGQSGLYGSVPLQEGSGPGGVCALKGIRRLRRSQKHRQDKSRCRHRQRDAARDFQAAHPRYMGAQAGGALGPAHGLNGSRYGAHWLSSANESSAGKQAMRTAMANMVRAIREPVHNRKRL